MQADSWPTDMLSGHSPYLCIFLYITAKCSDIARMPHPLHLPYKREDTGRAGWSWREHIYSSLIYSWPLTMVGALSEGSGHHEVASEEATYGTSIHVEKPNRVMWFNLIYCVDWSSTTCRRSNETIDEGLKT